MPNENITITPDKLPTLPVKGKLADFARELEIPGYPSKVVELLAKFITINKEMLLVKEKVKILSSLDCNLTVLILGETGTGKELIAQALHGDRKGKFVAVNCAGIPDTLLESEFFGCSTGAFTGSIARQGFLQEANNGTLFLDEIGDMPVLLQSKLLRVIQERRARRLGSTEEYLVNCRFVSATNKTEVELATSRNFRLDLFFRLAGTKLNLTPLRTRQEDVIEIIKSTGKLQLTEDIEKLAKEFIDPPEECFGNVRSLLNKIDEVLIEKQLSKSNNNTV